jgi:hypothetical protein
MRFIPRNFHGVIDYGFGLILIITPFLLGFADVVLARNLMIAMGCLVILYSLLTAYEAGAVKLIPFGTHLWIDAAGGVLLLAAPWLFGFADQVILPFVGLGLVELAVTLLTRLDSSVVSAGRANEGTSSPWWNSGKR